MAKNNSKGLLLAAFLLPALCFSLSFDHLQTQPTNGSSQNRFYINDAVSNYFYGPTGLENYFKQITASPTVIKCPIDKPFTSDGTACFQCTIQAPIFNFSTLKCDDCPGGTQVFANHECQPASTA